MSVITAQEADEAAKIVMARAATDADFRNRAIANPAEALKEATGKDLPANFKLRMVSNEGADLTLVLPDLQADTEELSDSDLEQVAGGRCGGSCGGSCVMMSS